MPSAAIDFTTSKRLLLKLLEATKPFAEAKGAIPSLANVEIVAEPGPALGKGKLTATAQNLYQGISGSIEADVAYGGSIAVNAKDLAERIKGLPDGEIQITVAANSNSLVAKAKGAHRKFMLHGSDAEDQPKMQQPGPDAVDLRVPAALLSDLIRRTHFAISTDETRPHVNSLLFDLKDHTVRLVATDGHRLALAEGLVTDALPRVPDFLVPLDGITKIRGHVEEARKKTGADGDVVITRSGPNVFFKVDGYDIFAKVIDAQFPPFAQVIPAKLGATVVRAPLAALVESINAVRLASPVKTTGVRFTVRPDLMILTAEAPECGNAHDEVPIDYAGPEVSVGFNARYVLDFLAAYGANDEAEVLLFVTGELDPMRVEPVEPAAAGLQWGSVGVCMPLNL